MSQLSDARATFRSERRPDMSPADRVDLAFVCAGLVRERRIARAFEILDVCRAEYGAAFEAVMRDRSNESTRLGLLRATRRYRWVTWILIGPSAAHRITAWRIAIGECPVRADVMRAA